MCIYLFGNYFFSSRYTRSKVRKTYKVYNEKLSYIIDELLNNKIEQEEVSEVLYLYNANTFFNDTSLSSVLNNE